MLRGSQLIAITAPFLAFATIILSLRLFTRFAVIKNAGAEDLLVVFAWVFATILFAFLVSVKEDLDYHIVVLFADPPRLAEFLKRFFVGIFMYNFSLTCSKLSIVLQYRRIFTDGKTSTALWFTVALIIVNCVWPFFTNLFFCSPIKKFWEPTIEGHCFNKKGVWFSYAGANIATSLVLLVLPLPAILRLQMRVKTKCALVVIFSFGIFDIILSCLRLASLESLSRTADFTWYIQPVGIWSSLESTVAIICASAPALKPLVSRFLPKYLSTLQSQESYSLPERSLRQLPGHEFGSNLGPIGYDGGEKMHMDVEQGDGNERQYTPRPRTAGRIGRESSY